jgi:hypothetical protein
MQVTHTPGVNSPLMGHHASNQQPMTIHIFQARRNLHTQNHSPYHLACGQQLHLASTIKSTYKYTPGTIRSTSLQAVGSHIFGHVVCVLWLLASSPWPRQTRPRGRQASHAGLGTSASHLTRRKCVLTPCSGGWPKHIRLSAAICITMLQTKATLIMTGDSSSGINKPH